jgi:hypothetical protein
MNNLTQEQVSRLNKGRLNNGIAKFLGIYMSDNGFGTVRVWVSGVPNSIKGVVKDYCDNWNDLMPLVLEHEIAFNPIDSPASFWVAGSNSYHPTKNKIPQRALAECLFLVLQEKANND